MFKVEMEHKGKRLVLCRDAGLVYWGSYGRDDKWIIRTRKESADRLAKPLGGVVVNA